MFKVTLLNLPNVVSCSRIPLAFLFIYFFREGHAFASAGMMVLIMCSDLVDGFLARKMGIASHAGNFVDRFADNVAAITVVTFFTGRQLLPAWVLVVLVLRELLVLDFRFTWSSLDSEAASKQKTSFLGKSKMALLMSGMLAMVFWPSYAATVFYLAVAASLCSAVTYLQNLPLLAIEHSD